jgi:hypothetical protein
VQNFFNPPYPQNQAQNSDFNIFQNSLQKIFQVFRFSKFIAKLFDTPYPLILGLKFPFQLFSKVFQIFAPAFHETEKNISSMVQAMCALHTQFTHFRFL